MFEADALLQDNDLKLIQSFLDDLYHDHYGFFKVFLADLYDYGSTGQYSIWHDPTTLKVLNQNKYQGLRAVLCDQEDNASQAETIKKAIMRIVVENAACPARHAVINPENPTSTQLTQCADYYQPATPALSSLMRR